MPSGVIKFFNGAKGFGFIAPDDGGSDVFVHVSAVERSGLAGLNEGDQVTFEVERDKRSGKFAAVDLTVVGFVQPAPRAPRPAGPRSFDRQSSRPAGGPREVLGAGSGVVKWFNPTKGFGFIQPSDGGSDVFVHISAVERAGLGSLSDGQAVSYDLEQDRRTGKPAATNLRLEG
ncbi:MAG: cold-shock protein [Alphaproteobacteria bacterium]|nr:cold-shock protein [Alphaproteobacteria bacterium]